MAERSGTGAGGPGGGDGPEPVFTGPLDALLGSAPVFRGKLRGYDPVEVDTYVAWAEGELRTVRRQVDDLLARFGACSAELEISRRLLAEAPRGRVFPVSERVEEMLQLAADEAAALVDAGAREAERLVAEARSEADARLRKAHEIKEMAVRAADELRDHARREQAEAQASLERARTEAAEVLRAAAEERDRLAAEQLTELRAQVAELNRQRDEARRSLRGLSGRIGEALEVIAATVPDAPGSGNVAIEGMEYDPAHVAPTGAPRATGDELVLVGRPAPTPS